MDASHLVLDLGSFVVIRVSRTLFNVKKSLMDGNGNVWVPVIGIHKHDTYPRPR